MRVLEKSWAAFHEQNQPKEDKINYGDANTLDKIAPSFSKKKKKSNFFFKPIYIYHILLQKVRNWLISRINFIVADIIWNKNEYKR